MALIPPGYMKAVVSLGERREDDYHHAGTGFVHYYPVNEHGGTTYYRAFLVTNKHVADGDPTHVRFNNLQSGLEIRPLMEVVYEDWFRHPVNDVAVVPLCEPGPLTTEPLREKGTTFIGRLVTPPGQELRSIAEGLGVFLIGFPLGIVGEYRNYPIVRSGVIARIQMWLNGDERTFLIDAPAFPGNSGGPVILRPTAAALKGTKAITHAYLIGLVSESISHMDTAFSFQTKTPRIVFVENTGISVVEPYTAIEETIEEAIRELPSSFSAIAGLENE